MRQQIVLATKNEGKIRELAEPLQKLGMELLGLNAFPEIGDIVEDGASFAENAFIKAKAVAEQTGLAAISDDSGLEVDALDKRPGIYSARYADDMPFLANETKDERNIRKLLMELQNVPAGKRTARFVCCMACVQPGTESMEQAVIVRGTWEGSILDAPRGTNGFGYDPVFFDEELHLAAAEMTKEQKMGRSHRGHAVQALLEKLAAMKKA